MYTCALQGFVGLPDVCGQAVAFFYSPTPPSINVVFDEHFGWQVSSLTDRSGE